MDGKRYRRGYHITHLGADIQGKLRAWEKTNLAACIVEALLTIGSIPAIGVTLVGSLWLLHGLGAAGWLLTVIIIAGYPLAATLIARQQRCLELMVHDASHRCWHGNSARLNNLAANLLVAFPMLSHVERYWRSHRVHHGTYGSDEDPCRRRFRTMGAGDIDLSTHWKLIGAVLRRLPRYNMAYYREIGSLSARQWGLFLLWHLLVFVAPLWIGLAAAIPAGAYPALSIALLAWILVWVVPATVFLPVLRSVAEMEEHDYDLAETEFGTTFTNTGWWHKALIHPRNDAYHLLHHMFPKIPERVHHRVHRLLMAHDPQYRSALHRTRVLQGADMAGVSKGKP
jgi:fatty acid desaturase